MWVQVKNKTIQKTIKMDLSHFKKELFIHMTTCEDNIGSDKWKYCWRSWSRVYFLFPMTIHNMYSNLISSSPFNPCYSPRLSIPSPLSFALHVVLGEPYKTHHMLLPVPGSLGAKILTLGLPQILRAARWISSNHSILLISDLATEYALANVYLVVCFGCWECSTLKHI